MLLSSYSPLSSLNIRVIHEWSLTDNVSTSGSHTHQWALTAAVSASGIWGRNVSVPLAGRPAGPVTLAN